VSLSIIKNNLLPMLRIKLVAVIVLSGMLCLLAPAAGSPARIIEPGDALPRMTCEQPLSAADKKYLQLPDEGGGTDKMTTVVITGLDAELLVLEFLNRYCPSCQAQVPLMNKTFQAVEQQPELKQKVRIIGIAAGNSIDEAEAFQNEKNIPFPILPDPDFIAYDAIGTPDGTPFTILARRVNGRFIVLSTHLGLIKSSDVLLQDIKNGLTADPAAIQSLAGTASKPRADRRMLKLKLPERELRRLVMQSMRSAAAADKQQVHIRLKTITLPKSGVIYQGTVAGETLYARVISRKPTCDICHGIHFIIVFNSEGVITGFTPVYLTKYGNIKWSDADIAFMREHVVGRSVLSQKPFNHKVDAVSTATMSSALIFNSLNKLQGVFTELKEAEKK
jgi:peroxiredoxin